MKFINSILELSSNEAYLIKSFQDEGIEVEPLRDNISNKLSNPYERYDGCDFHHAGNHKFKESVVIKHLNEKPLRYFYDQEVLLDIFNKEKDILGDQVLVVAGHYMPMNEDLSLIPSEPLKALQFGNEFINILKKSRKNVCLLICVNDIHLKDKIKDDEGNTIIINQRKEFWDNFSLPVNLQENLLKDVPVLVVSENKLAERLNKKRKRLVREGRLIKKDDAYYIGNSKIIDHHDSGAQARCVRGSIELMTIPEDLNCSGVVQIYPKCGINAEKGNRLYEKLYSNSMPRISFYTTNTCY